MAAVVVVAVVVVLAVVVGGGSCGGWWVGGGHAGMLLVPRPTPSGGWVVPNHRHKVTQPYTVPNPNHRQESQPHTQELKFDWLKNVCLA